MQNSIPTAPVHTAGIAHGHLPHPSLAPDPPHGCHCQIATWLTDNSFYYLIVDCQVSFPDSRQIPSFFHHLMTRNHPLTTSIPKSCWSFQIWLPFLPNICSAPMATMWRLFTPTVTQSMSCHLLLLLTTFVTWMPLRLLLQPVTIAIKAFKSSPNPPTKSISLLALPFRASLGLWSAQCLILLPR